MFTGIIEELGTVEKIQNYANVRALSIKAAKVSEDTKIGDSIAVNGVCLTVVRINKDILTCEVMPKTLETTNLKDLKIKDKINLERSLRLNQRLSGHLVSGHIDAVGIIREKTIKGENTIFKITIPQGLRRYLLSNGSIAVDGISLTIAGIKPDTFWVYIIPHTLKNTTLGFKAHSDKVNIELDMIGKYAFQALEKSPSRPSLNLY